MGVLVRVFKRGRLRTGCWMGGYSRGHFGERAVGTGEQHQEVEGEARQGPAGAPHVGGDGGGHGGHRSEGARHKAPPHSPTMALTGLGGRLASLPVAGYHLRARYQLLERPRGS